MSVTGVPAGAGQPDPEVPSLDFETTREIGYYQLVWRRFSGRRMALVALGILALLGIACFILPWYLPLPSPPANQSGTTFLGGSIQHPFGTDEIGRDLLTLNLMGGQISLTVGIVAMITTVFVATALGAIAGFFGGVVDSVLSSVTNAVLAIPTVLILITYAKLTTPSVTTIILGITVVAWPSTMRIIRSVVLSLREKEYVEAARALGTSRGRIITRHILPNALGPIIVSASLTVVAAILLESAVSFLGVGIRQPTQSWGSLLNRGYAYISSANDFTYAFWPGVMILITVMCFNYIGDALRDAFDPRAVER